jgi:hypothetical protein
MMRLFAIGLTAVLSWSFATAASAALVAYYPFNGNANEATGNNINLNLVGNAGFGSSVSPGLGSALALDGDGDGAIGSSFVKIAGNNMTAVAWANAASLDQEWNSIIKNWGQTVGGQFHFGLGTQAANTLQSIVAGATTLVAPTNFPTNEWAHVAFVVDAAALQHRLYINGAVVGTAAYTGTLGLGTATGLGIGYKPNDDGTVLATNGPGPWNGRLDDVGLFNEALSTAQIQQIYQNGLVGIPLVPEPSSVGLLIVLGASVCAARRRQM